MAENSEILCLPTEFQPLSSDTQIALHGVTRVLASVGRAFVCLDADFRHRACFLSIGWTGGRRRRPALMGRGIR